MEMIFLTAPPSLLWPDGIRERSEAVKANTSKRRKREGRRVQEGSWQDGPGRGERRSGGGWKKQENKVGFLWLKQRKYKVQL